MKNLATNPIVLAAGTAATAWWLLDTWLTKGWEETYLLFVVMLESFLVVAGTIIQSLVSDSDWHMLKLGFTFVCLLAVVLSGWAMVFNWSRELTVIFTVALLIGSQGGLSLMAEERTI